jgi:hypothetical protein
MTKPLGRRTSEKLGFAASLDEGAVAILETVQSRRKVFLPKLNLIRAPGLVPPHSRARGWSSAND